MKIKEITDFNQIFQREPFTVCCTCPKYYQNEQNEHISRNDQNEQISSDFLLGFKGDTYFW